MNNRKVKIILSISTVLILVATCFRPTEKDNSDTEVYNEPIKPHNKRRRIKV